jgi:hypothetical protein
MLLLSWDKGTAGQRIFFCPGTKGRRDKEICLSWDKGTTGGPVPDCPGTIPHRGNPTFHQYSLNSEIETTWISLIG